MAVAYIFYGYEISKNKNGDIYTVTRGRYRLRREVYRKYALCALLMFT